MTYAGLLQSFSALKPAPPFTIDRKLEVRSASNESTTDFSFFVNVVLRFTSQYRGNDLSLFVFHRTFKVSSTSLLSKLHNLRYHSSSDANLNT